IWVNTHGLFILGPILMCFYLTQECLRWLERRWRPAAQMPPAADWRLFVVAAAVALACLVNPYGVSGALFPIVLYPKVTAAGNVYKEYISEFSSMRQIVQLTPRHLGAGIPSVRAFYFVMLALPIVFVLPATWRLWHDSPPRSSG